MTSVTDENVRLQARLEKVTTRLAKLEAGRTALRVAHDDLRARLIELSSHYLLAGVKKKVDIREEEPFGTLARTILAEGRSGMNFDRLYTLWQGVMAAPPSLPIVEVGVYKGGSSRFMAESLRIAGRTPAFYACDTFRGHARVDDAIEPVHAEAGLFTDTSADAVRNYLAGHPNVEVVEGDILETAARFAGVTAFGFVHVDVDVYHATAFCLETFGPRLAPGAWLVVDDYATITCPGARKAADEFARAHADRFRLVHLLSGQALVYRFN